MAKYDAWRALLERFGHGPVEVSFDELADAVGGLPPSAFEHAAWWANHAGNPQARAWMEAGRRVDMVSLPRRRVRFVARVQTGTAAAHADEAKAMRDTSTVAPPPHLAAPSAPLGPVLSAVTWNAVWQHVAAELAGHTAAGRSHLVTEDVVRYRLTILRPHGVRRSCGFALR